MFEGWVTQICQVNPAFVNINNINFYQWNDDRIEGIAKKDKSRYKMGQDNSGLYVKQGNTEWQMMHAHLKPNKDGQQQFLDCFWVIRTYQRQDQLIGLKNIPVTSDTVKKQPMVYTTI